MALEPVVLICITVIAMVLDMLFNKYLVILEYNHSYYTLFNKLKFQRKEQEDHD